ncbi:hypothetical protein CKY10_09145 [Photorhabdus sp. HUG-39]|nr:hypothetical protein CKY10_09145 [Photorhabdus sp. HUG-39]
MVVAGSSAIIWHLTAKNFSLARKKVLPLKEALFAFIPVIFQVASLLTALTHPGHIVRHAPGDSLPCRRDAS